MHYFSIQYPKAKSILFEMNDNANDILDESRVIYTIVGVVLRLIVEVMKL